MKRFNPGEYDTTLDGLFTDGDEVSGTPASDWPAEAANAVYLEIENAIKAAGITPSRNDLTQLAQAIAKASAASTPLQRGFLMAPNSENPTTHIDIGAGIIAAHSHSDGLLVEDFSEYLIMPAMTKRLDAAFAAGSGNGLRASSVSLAQDTTYHIFAVKMQNNGLDYLADTSVLGANLIASHNPKKLARIGFGLTMHNSTQLVPFDQYGPLQSRLTVWRDQYNEYSSNPTTGATNTTLKRSPKGINTRILIDAGWTGNIAENMYVRFSSMAQDNVSPGAGNAQLMRQGGVGSEDQIASARIELISNASGQIRHRGSQNEGTLTFSVAHVIDSILGG